MPHRTYTWRLAAWCSWAAVHCRRRSLRPTSGLAYRKTCEPARSPWSRMRVFKQLGALMRVTCRCSGSASTNGAIKRRCREIDILTRSVRSCVRACVPDTRNPLVTIVFNCTDMLSHQFGVSICKTTIVCVCLCDSLPWWRLAALRSE